MTRSSHGSVEAARSCGGTARPRRHARRLRAGAPRGAEAIGYLPRFLERATDTAGALELLHQLRTRAIPTAVVTSASMEWVEHALTQVLDARHLVTTVVSAEDVEKGKPDPAGYVLGCARLSVRPSDAVAFEDAPAGVQAAWSAGVGMVVGVRSSPT